ncbi:DJ-1/PfpI family protein [Alicyclobacillus fastidiosus]|uniref:DJ-1/PfpI family protein n=1 Tax=Alicyclobacillus fastidiosus TaxID=392011 RepID=A0ABY6ZFI6_9BACL|nr:DJ-1/PfpI family protein [Alicyclobacillus fastidiosus]WAH40880.1 DJ-1/PfpI family protein [Alicyclobacillus fastidiosus]GMA62370.1 hypothetical protein GCM10025859_28100 [Alicyclobacillus fastidiosus]
MYKVGLVALPRFALAGVSTLLQSVQEREWRLRVFSLAGDSVTTAEGLRVMADAAMQDTVPLDLHLLVIPGGHYTSEIWNDTRLHRFLRQYDGQRRWIATASEGIICVAAAGLLGGTMYSAPEGVDSAFAHLLRHAIRRQSPVTVDANVISSDGTEPATFANVVCQRVELQF